MLLATINSSILLIDTDACAELLAAATTAFPQRHHGMGNV